MLQHMGAILACLREGNVAMRWLLLHASAHQKKLRAAVAAAAPPLDTVLTTLIHLSLLELRARTHHGLQNQVYQEEMRMRDNIRERKA